MSYMKKVTGIGGGYQFQHPVQNRLAKVESFRDFEDFLNLVS